VVAGEGGLMSCLLFGICFILRSNVGLYVCMYRSCVIFVYSDCVCGSVLAFSVRDPFFQCGVYPYKNCIWYEL
jgi:hypothetical protein